MEKTLPTRAELRARVRRLSRTKKVIAAAVTATLAATGVVAGATAASAADEGPGLVLYGDYGAWGHRGSFIEGGASIWCLDWTLDGPVGASPSNIYRATSLGPNDSGNQHAVGPEELGRINYILSTYGGTGDPLTAAAVDLASASFLQNGGVQGMAKYVSQSSEGPDVLNLAQSMVNEANGVTIGGSVTPGSGELVFTVDHNDNYRGQVTMQGSAGATGDVTLVNGFFDDNGNGIQDAGESSTKSDMQANTAYTVFGIAPEDGSPYKISGSGDWSVGGGQVWPGEVDIVEYGSGIQRMARAIGPVSVDTAFHVEGMDPQSRSSLFQPILTSAAPQYVKAGEQFSDAITFATSADDQGVNNSWYRNASGRYAPITATATIYGPFATAPAEAAEAPAGAPVAGTASLTTDPANGPTVTYTATSDAVATDSGYYAWVWTIDRAAQDPRVQNFLPDGYTFRDRFALTAETSLVPAEVSTKAQPEAYVGNSFTDTAIVKGSLPTDGAQLHFELYAAKQDENGTWVCTEGNLLWTSDEQTVTTSGEYVSPQAPGQLEGTYNWVEVLNDQRGTELHRGECGIANETTKVVPPTVSTKSQAGSKLGDTLKDTAIIEGTLPEDGAQLTFDAYQVPMVQGADGKWVVDTSKAPQGTEAGDLSWVCSDDNVVFHQEVAQDITEAGEYDSESFTTDAYGKVFWVETLSWGNNIIHRGECGLDNETSFVVDVTTKAQTSSSTSDTPTLNDTASLVGYVPEDGYTVFEAYRVAGNVNAGSCTADNLVFTSDKVALQGGLYAKDAPLEVTGGGFTAESWNDASNVYWVEKTYDKLDRLVSTGECGHGDETTAVAASAVIVTGVDGASTPWALGGVFGFLLLAAAGTIVAIRRRSSKADKVSAE